MSRIRNAQITRVERRLLITTMLLAFGLRIYRLAGQSIWYDEGLSVYYARRPLSELLTLVSASDHPPFYFLLLHLWLRVTAFGQPTVEFLVRYPSVAFGVLLIPLTYTLGRRLFGHHTGIAAAMLTAISPLHVWYSQEARMYTLVVFLTLWASYVLWTNIQYPVSGYQHSRSRDEGTPSRWGVYGLVTTLALYAHFYAGLVLLAHAVFVAWWARRHRRWHTWLTWAGTSALALLIFAPWGGMVAGQLQANDTYWRGTLALGRTVAHAAQAFAVGETLTGSPQTLATAVYLLLAGIGLLHGVRNRRTRDETIFLLSHVAVPLGALLAISYNRPKFAPRYLLTVTPALVLLVSQGIAALSPRAAQRRLGTARYATAAMLTGAVIVGSSVSVWRHYTDETLFKADWRAAAGYINQHAGPQDAVVIVAGHAMPAFDFYNARQFDVYPILPRLLPTVSDPVVSDEVTSTLNRLTREGHDRVWLILWQERLADPRRLTLTQLFEYARRLGVNQGFHNLGVLLFEIPPGTVFEPPRPEHRLRALYGRRLRLEGYDLSTSTVIPTETLTLRLYWRAVEPISRDYTAFTQLLSADNQIVGQHDHRLGSDLYPTSRWPIGEPVREVYELTVQGDTQPGRYRLIAGVYLPPAGPRLPVEGNNARGDHVVVAEIEVTEQ